MWRAVWVETCSKLGVAGKDFYGCCAYGSIEPQYNMICPPDAPEMQFAASPLP